MEGLFVTLPDSLILVHTNRDSIGDLSNRWITQVSTTMTEI